MEVTIHTNDEVFVVADADSSSWDGSEDRVLTVRDANKKILSQTPARGIVHVDYSH